MENGVWKPRSRHWVCLLYWVCCSKALCVDTHFCMYIYFSLSLSSVTVHMNGSNLDSVLQTFPFPMLASVRGAWFHSLIIVTSLLHHLYLANFLSSLGSPSHLALMPFLLGPPWLLYQCLLSDFFYSLGRGKKATLTSYLLQL
jgi:hypothetical protein